MIPQRLSYLVFCLMAALFTACVDPLELDLRGTVDVVVVDGTITNLAEPQRIRLNRSRADPYNGRFGTIPINNARVQLLVDSSESITLTPKGSGIYELPASFRGAVGHAYQLFFAVADQAYQSDQQIMPAVPGINKLSVRFNELSLPANLFTTVYRAGYDLYIETLDPADQQNYYRWDWKLYEKQNWCRSCYQGQYRDSVQQLGYVNGTNTFIRVPVEDCVPDPFPRVSYHNDYRCRTPCWDILINSALNLFDDRLTNGRPLTNRPIAQVPFYTRQPALLFVRQSSLTAGAYAFFQQLQQQTQKTGGLADTPPTAPIGNVRNLNRPTEQVVGFFTASAVAVTSHWFDKKDATSLPIGAYDEAGVILESTDELFYAQNRRRPAPGPDGPPFSAGGPTRPITAPCLPEEFRTPIKPTGWRD